MCKKTPPNAVELRNNRTHCSNNKGGEIITKLSLQVKPRLSLLDNLGSPRHLSKKEKTHPHG